jgi:Family of unknown function (DUF5681)
MSQFQKGVSGNPSGRPPGRTLQTKLREATAERFDELAKVLVDQALAGDMQAMGLLMNRMIPVLRPVQEPQAFALSGDTLTQKAHAILAAVAEGEISSMDGKALLDAVGGVVKVEDAEHTQRQLELIRLALDADTKMMGQRR